MSETAQRLYERYLAAINARDWETLGSLLHDDFVEEWPQSGERVRGRENLIASTANYPGADREPEALGTEAVQVVGSEDRFVVSPVFTTIRLVGTGDVYTGVSKGHYPDGSEWFSVSLFTIRDGRIHRMTTYFAPRFEAPAWRAQWVERM